MGLDIRLPIGLMFTTFGLLLSGFGLFSDRSIYSQSLGININLLWGVVLLVFGLLMMGLGMRHRATSINSTRSEEEATAAQGKQ